MIEELHGYKQVVDAAGDDPYARWGIDPALPIRAWAQDGAVAWTVPREHYAGKPWLTALGPASAAAPLVAALLIGRLDPLRDDAPAGLTVPHDTLALLPRELRPPEHGDWCWWWTDEAPALQLGEELVVDLDVAASDRDREDLGALLREANPIASAPPEDDAVRGWLGLRTADGHLVACAANRPYVPSITHLASIATHPDVRRRGYGAAVTAASTRRGLESGAPAVTLGMYANNEAGRSLYRRLGFREAHRFTSGDLRTTPAMAG